MSTSTPYEDLLQALSYDAFVGERLVLRSRHAVALADLASDSRTAAAVDAGVRHVMLRAVGRLLDHGWTRADLERIVVLRAWPAAVAMLDELIAMWGGELPAGSSPWLYRKVTGDVVTPTATIAAIGGVFAVLQAIPTIPVARVPDHDVPGFDADVLRKVRALLAKAESTSFPEEAQALSAKAQQLITRHAIDQALLESQAEHDIRSKVVGIESPYSVAKWNLLAAIAAANRCRTLWCEFSSSVIVLGTPSDIDAVDLLFTSLLTQATTSMLAHGPITDSAGRPHTRAFRRSFLLGFAGVIGNRLREANDTETAATAGERGSALPVLLSRQQAVDDTFAKAFPQTTSRRISHTSSAGVAAGARAGQAADLGFGRVRGARAELAG